MLPRRFFATDATGTAATQRTAADAGLRFRTPYISEPPRPRCARSTSRFPAPSASVKMSAVPPKPKKTDAACPCEETDGEFSGRPIRLFGIFSYICSNISGQCGRSRPRTAPRIEKRNPVNSPTETMIVIADSGSTKCNWQLVDDSGSVRRVQSRGINAVLQRPDEVEALLRETFAEPVQADALHFYGAGCGERYPEQSARLREALARYFPRHASPSNPTSWGRPARCWAAVRASPASSARDRTPATTTACASCATRRRWAGFWATKEAGRTSAGNSSGTC